ncbi:uncharacterized protein LOC143885519 isoform X3 [Tasmannia lanceolata]|uniref:uncharacterized protein LOC143885519 isoform X3 n=1 Tax=Tasmannia lanceolata TaxID=3420 RepID=UPI004063C529
MQVDSAQVLSIALFLPIFYNFLSGINFNLDDYEDDLKQDFLMDFSLIHYMPPSKVAVVINSYYRNRFLSIHGKH